MSEIKNLQIESMGDSGLNCLVDNIKNKGISYENDIYFNLEYPGLADFFQFFLTDSNLQLANTDEKYYAILYYFYKNAYKKLPLFLTKLEKGKKINLRNFLFEVFFETRDSRIIKIPNCVNKQPEEIEDLIDWEKVKEEYPLASRSNYHLLHNKTFLEETKKKFLSDYTSKSSEFCSSIIGQAEDIKDIQSLFREFIDTLSNIESSSNFIEIYVKDYLLFGVFNRFYVDNEKKKNRLNRKNDKVVILNDEKNRIFQNMMKMDGLEQVSNINLLSEEEKNTIDSIMQKFDMVGEREKKKIKKYIIRLTIKKKPFKVGWFLKNNNLNELPEGVIGLLDDLMIDIVDEEENNEKIGGVVDEGISTSEENEEIVTRENLIQGINKEIFNLFSKDPIVAVIEKVKLCNYSIENENLLRKQIESLCNSSKFLRDTLLITLLKKSFSRPILKHSGFYSLRVGGSGCRFVLKQNSEGNFVVIGFYNHDDYEKVLDGRIG